MDKRTPLSFSVQKDMRPIYRALYERFPEGFPEIFVFDRLPEDMKICKRSFPDGRYAIFVCDDDNDALVTRLIDEILTPKSPEYAIAMTYMTLSDEEVSQWLIYACYIADILNVPLKQIMFLHGESIAGYSEEFITLLQDDLSLPEMLMMIAHELRHAWQHVHHPEWLDDYIYPEDDVDAYQRQLAEIDAEAFAIKVESMITGVEFVNSSAGLKMDPSYRASLIARMHMIDVVLSKQKLHEIRKLIKLDEVLQSVREEI